MLSFISLLCCSKLIIPIVELPICIMRFVALIMTLFTFTVAYERNIYSTVFPPIISGKRLSLILVRKVKENRFIIKENFDKILSKIFSKSIFLAYSCILAEIEQCSSSSSLTSELRQVVVDLHNKLRSSVALGIALMRGGQRSPSASNMNKLVNFVFFLFQSKVLSELIKHLLVNLRNYLYTVITDKAYD